MTDVIRKMTVQTQNHGLVEYWLEARVNNADGMSYGEVWCSSMMWDDKRYHGTGVTAAKAVMDVIQNVQIATDPAEPPVFPGHSYGESSRTNAWDPAASEPAEPAPVFEYKGLPEAFWKAIREDRKISAIKELRSATNLTLVAAKSLVDYIIPRGKSNFTAANAPVGAIIRIHGLVTEHRLHRGWVFEKDGEPNWVTTGFEDDYTDSFVQDAMDAHGFDIIFTPKERSWT